MIHSLAGGDLKDYKVSNLVYVELEEQHEKCWYISDALNINVGDFVLVPFGKIDEPKRAKVLKIIKDAREDMLSISFKKFKKIYKKA